MQLNYHSPLRPSISQPKYRPIFYRIKERNSQPVSPVSEVPPDLTIVWEKRFIKCSYAMVRSPSYPSRLIKILLTVIGSMIEGNTLIEPVLRPLLLLGIILFPLDQTVDRFIQYDPLMGFVPRLSGPSGDVTNVPTRC